MSDPITAAAIGAGISGGTSLLQGKKLGTSLRDAAIGGAMGGAGGAAGGECARQTVQGAGAGWWRTACEGTQLPVAGRAARHDHHTTSA